MHIGDVGPSKPPKDKGKAKASSENLEGTLYGSYVLYFVIIHYRALTRIKYHLDTELNRNLLYLLQSSDSNVFHNAPLRINERSTPSNSEYP